MLSGMVCGVHSPYLAALAAGRAPGTAEKGKRKSGQQLSSVPGDSASSREPSLTSSAFFASLKALKLWLCSQELTQPSTELQCLTVPLPVWSVGARGLNRASSFHLSPPVSSRPGMVCLRVDTEQAQ